MKLFVTINLMSNLRFIDTDIKNGTLYGSLVVHYLESLMYYFAILYTTFACAQLTYRLFMKEVLVLQLESESGCFFRDP